jgi:hypothetical protein
MRLLSLYNGRIWVCHCRGKCATTSELEIKIGIIPCPIPKLVYCCSKSNMDFWLLGEYVAIAHIPSQYSLIYDVYVTIQHAPLGIYEPRRG